MERPNRILVVEDDPDVAAATVRVLSRAGYEVSLATNGLQGLEKAMIFLPDLILTDAVMPDLEGPELCRRVKAEPALRGTLCVLLSSSRTDSDDQAAGLESGADGYIARPIPNRELLARVQSMMRIRKAELERDRVIQQLEDALAQVRTLNGLIPICVHCKKIRNDDGFWKQVEEYVHEHTGADFSHGYCPDCMRKHYPEDLP